MYFNYHRVNNDKEVPLKEQTRTSVMEEVYAMPAQMNSLKAKEQ
jgi:hypothetical protein